jgi:tetratricopeptide (TPR) repeat protein
VGRGAEVGGRPRARADARRGRRAAAALALLTAVAVFALYARTVSFGYVFDDAGYIVGNPGLARGLAGGGVRWALTAYHHGNWHPVAWLAHLADRALFGPAAGPAHLVNAGLHALCAALLLLVLRGLTGALWPSAFAAALFALHPLRVESVAWVTERKDALSAIFWLLGTAAHLRFARRPAAGPYALVAACFALGLMTKATVVTFPLALLLLDAWPLGRMGRAGRGGTPLRVLLLEKLPLLLLSALAAALALASQREVGAVQSLEAFSLPVRAANAAVAAADYLRDTVWPAGLAVFYPHPGPALPAARALAAAVLLAAVTAAALRLARRLPAVAVGWLWFLGTLVPVAGIVQVGAQARADRYTYLPSIGLAVGLAWGVERLTVRVPRRAVLLAPLACVVLGALAAASSRQIGFWRDDASLFGRALAVTRDNWLAENNYGRALEGRGDIAGALAHYRAALAARPDYPAAHVNAGIALGKLGRREEAAQEYERALRARPDLAEAHLNLGVIEAERGFPERALSHYRAALRTAPGLADAHLDLGNALADLGRFEEALAEYAAAGRLAPGDAEVPANRGVTLAQMGRPAEAEAEYRAALRLEPGNRTALRGLAALPGR